MESLIVKRIKRILKKVLKYIGYLTNLIIYIKITKRTKIKVHPKAVNDGSHMQCIVDLIQYYCNYIPKNVFEIGANFGQDAEYFRKSFKIDNKNVFVFEPHPIMSPGNWAKKM